MWWRPLARQRTFRGTGRKIDFKQWSAAPGLILESAAAGQFLSGNLSFNVPATILRWRGYVSAVLDETMQAGDRVVLTYGIAVLSADAIALGDTAVPDPATEPEYPWVWWKEFTLEAYVAAGHIGGWGPNAQRYDIDSKAMRKVKPGEGIVIVGDRTNLAGAPVVNHDIGQLRVLIGT